jgi:hypothetical protein
MTTSNLSLYWDIQNDDKYTGVPVRQKTKNYLDAHGTLLDLKRLPEESNFAYWKRLQSVIPLRASSTNEGLVHGITRELGLEEKIGIKISPVLEGEIWKAPSPKVEVTSTSLILYSSYTDSNTYTIDSTIDIFDHGSGYLVGDLVSEIQSSEYFVAELGPNMTGSEKSNGLIPNTSHQTVVRELVPANKYWTFNNDDIVVGSVTFGEKDIFYKEVTPAIATPHPTGLTLAWAISSPVVEDGDYYIDYNNGIVTSKLSASGKGFCRYQHRSFPLYIKWSPVVVYSLRDTSYRNKVFESETMPDNSTRLGLVTAEGVDVYEQIFEKSESLWGE